mgnify:CR=1 FL=1
MVRNVPEATKSRLIVFHEMVNEDLNVSPRTFDVDALGYGGDKYDLHPVWFLESEGVSSTLDIYANGDNTNNWRSYEMVGNGGSASGAVNDTSDPPSLTVNNGYPVLGMTSILGESSDERLFGNTLASQSNGASNTRIFVRDAYWKNTADPVNTITFSKSASVNSNGYIAIFAIPKESNQEQWELLDTLEWNAESGTKDFTGLNGDVDGTYFIRFFGDDTFNFTLNNDVTNSYIAQYMRNNGGVIQAQKATQSLAAASASAVDIVINAKSGSNRLCELSGSRLQLASQQNQRLVSYQNTGDNITSIECFPTTSTTGKAQLFRQRTPNHTADVLPWETIKEIPVSGDFSAGELFDDLDGENTFLYRAELIGEGANSTFYTRFNEDATSSYDEQRLRASLSVVSAKNTINSLGFFSGSTQGASVTTLSDMIIYPKSGNARPLLTRQYFDEDTIDFHAAWWDNTGDPISNMRVYASNTASVNLTLRLSKIPMPTP